MTGKLTLGQWSAVFATLLAAAALLAVWVLLVKPESGPAIVYLPSQDWNVINGTAYDCATMDLTAEADE